MKKTAVYIFTACLLCGGFAGLFAQDIQNPRRSLNEYSREYRAENMRVLESSFGTKEVIWTGVIASAGLGMFKYLMSVKEASFDYADFLKAERESEALQTINSVAKELGPDLDKAQYARIELDAYQLRKILRQNGNMVEVRNFYDGVYKNRVVLEELMTGTHYSRSVRSFNFIKEGKGELSKVLREYPGRVDSYLEMYGRGVSCARGSMEDVALSTFSRATIESILKKRTFFITAGLLLAISQLNAETQEAVSNLALRRELAFTMDPDTADAKIFDAVDSLRDKSLRYSIIKDFEEAGKLAAELKNRPLRERQNFLRGYKEQTKEYSFEGRRTEEARAQGDIVSGGMGRYIR